MDHEEFVGGMNSVRRVGQTVVRPAGPHSATVHRLLQHVRDRGFVQCPEPISLDPTTDAETLTFLPGDVTDYPATAPFRSDEVLVEAANVLRTFHDASIDFVADQDHVWFLPTQEPAEVICHGDFGPHNCVVVDGHLAGVFDFDTAHPGPRLLDVGYAVYRWVPLVDLARLDTWDDLDGQCRRLKLFCDAYGVETFEALDAAVERLEMLVDFMREQAADGNEAFVRHLAEGHDQIYLDDAKHITSHRSELGV